MTPAAHPHGGKTGLHGGLALRGGTPARTAIRLEPVPQQPMAHRPPAPTNSLGKFGDCHAGADEPLELLPREPAASGVGVPVDRLQPVFLHPVRNRRFVPPEPLADLGQRKSAAQELLERSAIHGRIFLSP